MFILWDHMLRAVRKAEEQPYKLLPLHEASTGKNNHSMRVNKPFTYQEIQRIKEDLGDYLEDPEKYIRAFKGVTLLYDLRWKDVIYQFSSVIQSCLTLCNPMDRSTPGLPVHHQLPESTKTHVHCVRDAIQPYHPLLSPSPPALNLYQHQGLISNELAPRVRWPKYWSFSFNISPSNEHPGLISFRMDWLDGLSLQSKDSQESSPTPQFKSINSLALSIHT